MTFCKPIQYSLLFVIAFIIECSTNVVGGSSDTEVSASVSGIVKDNFGKPVPGALVRLRPSEYSPGISISEQPFSKTTIADCYTDSNGFFVLDSIYFGDYSIDIRCSDSVGDTIGVIENLFIDSQCTIMPTLKPLGMISGDIDFPYGYQYVFQKPVVKVLGTEVVTSADSMGHFQFSIPPGTHQMRICVDSSSFNEIRMGIKLYESQSYYIGKLQMNMTPFSCFNYSCDSSTIRSFLDEAGYPEISVEQVTQKKYGRINAINFRGIKINISLSALSMLNAVEYIDLGNTGITDSCRFVGSLWNLQKLLLDSNSISGLSRCFESLFKLKILNVAYNSLSNIPDKMIYVHLDTLDLSGNKLCDLPVHIQRWADANDPDWYDFQQCD